MLADMLALKSGQVTKQDLLGVAALYVVPDRPVPAHDLATAWASEGLPAGMVPDGRQPVHTFMRACDTVKTGARGVPSANRIVEITADVVVHDSTECVYQITRLTRDRAAQVINHKRAMTIRFVKNPQVVGVGSPLAAPAPADPIEVVTADGDMSDVEQKIRDYYAANQDTVPGQKVRNAVRDTMLSLNASNLRGKSGGAYFVPIDGIDSIESMQRVLAKLYGDDAWINVLPWLNTTGARNDLEKHHVSNVRGTCEKLITKISERKAKDSKPRTDMVHNLLAERRELGEQVREYRELLGRDVEAVEAAMELLDDQIEDLMVKHATPVTA